MAQATVLVIDDDRAIVEFLSVALEAEGYTVLCAIGAQAISMARDRAPDLILLDINMPGMNGREVSKRLRADPRTAGIPIVVMSAQSNLGAASAGMPADDQLSKPFTIQRLYDVVAQWTTRNGASLVTQSAADDALLVTALDAPAYESYTRAAQVLHSTPPALARHVLTAAAPVLSDAADELERSRQNPRAADLQLHMTLVRGEMRLQRGTRCVLSAEALRRYEPVMQTVARAQRLLEEAGFVCAKAQVAVAQAKAQQAQQVSSALS